jgi:hypothetical protein
MNKETTFQYKGQKVQMSVMGAMFDVLVFTDKGFHGKCLKSPWLCEKWAKQVIDAEEGK